MATAAGVSSALRRLLQEVRRFGWQILLVGSGFWLEAAVCAESFVVDCADALEGRRPRLATAVGERWGDRIVREVWERLIRAFRWCVPGTRACRGLVMRIDTALLERRGPQRIHRSTPNKNAPGR